MPIGWYLIPYVRAEDLLDSTGPPARIMGRPVRYSAIEDYIDDIVAFGGTAREVEVLGDRAIWKVRARAGVLTALNGLFQRLPKDRIDDPLSDLSQTAKTKIRNTLTDMGYSIQEIKNRFGNNLGDYTLRDILKFMAKRRRRPRYDEPTDWYIMDGPETACSKTIEELDGEVTE